ncbi:hypothetical protein IFR05_010075 [Cadophora sp. M221]|nr:hypothetical protein IFR05_010075 [Cadophora sp. M221]
MPPSAPSQYDPNPHDPPRKRLQCLLWNWVNSPALLDLNINRDQLFTDSEPTAHWTDIISISDMNTTDFFHLYGFQNPPDLHQIKFQISTSLENPAEGIHYRKMYASAEAEKADGTEIYVNNELTEGGDDPGFAICLDAGVRMAGGRSVDPLPMLREFFNWKVLTEYLKYGIRRRATGVDDPNPLAHMGILGKTTFTRIYGHGFSDIPAKQGPGKSC